MVLDVTLKRCFGQTKMEYLDFEVTGKHVRMFNKKIESIKNMIPTSTKWKVWIFIILVYYY